MLRHKTLRIKGNLFARKLDKERRITLTIRISNDMIVENRVMYVHCSQPQELDMLGCEPFTPER